MRIYISEAASSSVLDESIQSIGSVIERTNESVAQTQPLSVEAVNTQADIPEVKKVDPLEVERLVDLRLKEQLPGLLKDLTASLLTQEQLEKRFPAMLGEQLRHASISLPSCQ